MNLVENYKSIKNSQKVFISVDIETTGLDPYQDKIIEIGAIKYKGDNVLDTYSVLINPQISISQTVSQIHGITNEDVKDKQSFGDIFKNFLVFISNDVLIAHNASFDITFINEELKRTGSEALSNQIVDTLHMARTAFKGKKSYSLQNLAKDFNIETGQAHRATDDAKACLDLFLICNKELNPDGQMALL